MCRIFHQMHELNSWLLKILGCLFMKRFVPPCFCVDCDRYLLRHKTRKNYKPGFLAANGQVLQLGFFCMEMQAVCHHSIFELF